MMAENLIDYKVLPFKKMTSPNNKELVTLRANIINKKTVLTFSLGVNICDVINFNKSDRVNIFTHKRDRNIYMIKKSHDANDGYILKLGNSFMTFSIRYPGMDGFRLSQTVPVEYDLNDEESLLINIEKIYWRK